MKHIEIQPQMKNKGATLVTTNYKGHYVDLYYMNSKEDVYNLRDKLNEFIEYTYEND